MNQQPAPVPKKKRHLGLWITLIVIFVIVILPIGLVFAFFFDPSHTTSEEIGVNTTTKAKPFTENLVVDLFDYTDNAEMKNSLSLSVGETDINQLLYDNLLSNMDANTRSFVPQAFLTIENEEYVFTVELNAYGFFKTKLYLYTSLIITDNPKGLMFELKNLKLGRLGGVQNIALKLLENGFDDAKLTALLKQNLPLNIESHIFTEVGGRRYLFYPHQNFISDLSGMMNMSGQAAFFQDFIINMFDSQKFTFDFYKEKAIHGLMSLQEFHDNASYCSYNDYVIDYGMKAELNKYLPTLLKEGKVTNSNIDTFTKYFSFGYSQLSESQKTTIDGAAFLPALLNKSTAEYAEERETKFGTKGKALSEVERAEDIVSNQVSNALTPTRVATIIANNGGKVVDAQIKETELHDVLKTNEIIGTGKTLYRQNSDGSYKIAYVLVDNLYVNIVNNNIYFIVGLNINGYEISMVLSSILQSGGNGKMYFKLDGANTYFGNYKIGSSLFDSFTNLLGQVMDGSAGWFSYDKNANRFVVDFASAVNDNEQIKLLKANGLNIDIGISAVGTSISENGYLNIEVNASRS